MACRRCRASAFRARLRKKSAASSRLQTSKQFTADAGELLEDRRAVVAMQKVDGQAHDQLQRGGPGVNQKSGVEGPVLSSDGSG
jgi:hypothetical protein